MKKHSPVSLILGALMIASAILARIMTPTVMVDAQQGKINLEAMIPLEFGTWRLDHSIAPPMVNPDAEGLLNKIYNQTLSRIYVNNEGERVMLSIAYGQDQVTDLHVHRPEICYASSGFKVSKMTKTFVETSIGRIPVMQLVAKKVGRSEPITYWIRVGDSLTRGWIEQKLTAIGYGLAGKIPDGLLFRISTISNDELNAYFIQQNFLSALLQTVQNKDRHWLVGQLAR